MQNNIITLTSQRNDGAMKKNNKLQEKNIERFLLKHKIKPKNLVLADQIHGSGVSVINNLQTRVIQGTDGVVTKQKNIFLGIVTADCIPLIFYDAKEKIIGLAHVGYKGLLLGIIENMIAAIEKLNGNMKQVQVRIGPSIGVCCYSVDNSRTELFKKKFPIDKDIFQIRDEIFYLDLKKICTIELVQQGVLKRNIEVSPYCTSSDNELFFSFRKEGPDNFGEILTVIGMV